MLKTQNCNYFKINVFQANKTLPDNKTLSVELSKKPELQKYMKRVMPFVQATREKLQKLGSKALAVTLEFNEAEVLKNNSIYLANTLDVLKFKFCFTIYLINFFI